MLEKEKAVHQISLAVSCLSCQKNFGISFWKASDFPQVWLYRFLVDSKNRNKVPMKYQIVQSFPQGSPDFLSTANPDLIT